MPRIFILILSVLLTACISQPLKKTATWIKDPENRNERIEFSLEKAKTEGGTWVPGAMRSGDILEYGVGKYTVPQLKTDVVVRGQGKDKTTLVGSMGVFSFAEPDVVFKDVTIMNPAFYLKTSKSQITLTNVRVVGQINMRIYDFNDNFSRSYSNPAKRALRYKQIGAQITFINADFEQPYQPGQYSYNDDPSIFIGPSRLKQGDKYVPYMMKKIGKLDLTEAYEEWMKVDVSEPNSQSYLTALSSVRKKIQRLKESDALSAMAKNTFTRMDKSFEKHGINSSAITVSEKALAEASELFKKAKSFQANGNHFLAAYAMNRAKEISAGKISGLEQAIADNKKAMEKLYGCNLSVKQLDRTRSTYSPRRGGIEGYNLNRTIAQTEFENSMNELSPLFVALGGESSNCQIQVNVLVNHFLGKNTGTQIISKRDVYRQKSDPIAAMAKRAAREAAWDAAMARTDAAVNKMTSTTRQLYENRNTIESRSGGTYLVINNKQIQDTGVADRQRVADLEAQSQQAVAAANASASSNMVKTGDIEVESSYYMSMRDAYQIQLDMSSGNEEGVSYQGPLAQNSRSYGPCRRKVNTGGIGADISGPCENQYYNADHNLRREYIQNAISPVLLEYLSQNVISGMVKKIADKATSSSEEDKLEGMVLSYLITEKVDETATNKAKKLVDKAFDFNKVQDYTLY